MGLFDFLGGGSSGGMEDAARNAAINAGKSSAWGDWLQSQTQRQVEEGAPIQSNLMNTYLAMQRGEDPTGAASQQIGGANQNYNDAMSQINANYAGMGRAGSGFEQNALTQATLDRARTVSGIQAQGRQTGTSNLANLLGLIKQQAQGFGGAAGGAYGAASSGYGTAGGLESQAYQARNSGTQNALNLAGTLAMAYGASQAGGGGAVK